MAVHSSGSDAVVVLDVGRTALRLLAVAPSGAILSSRFAPNILHSGLPYPHLDVEHLWRWLPAALADLGERFHVLALVPTAYSTAAACLAGDELVLPIMDQTATVPPAIAARYAEVAPWFEECRCAIGPDGMTVGRQLYWQRHGFPERFDRVTQILLLPQYLALGLSGIAASEVTALGAQTQLFNPGANTFSSLVDNAGLRLKFPPRRAARSVLGVVRPALAARAAVASDTPVLCGIDRSAAGLTCCRAVLQERLALVATGEWIDVFVPGLPLDRLDPLRDTAAVLDPAGRAVATARFMGGREHALLTAEHGPHAAPTLADVLAVLDAGTMALPSFAAGGPFPNAAGHGRIAGPAPRTGRAAAALASLYLALCTAVLLDLLESEGSIVVDGPCTSDPLFGPLLAALRPHQPVALARDGDPAALGAAMLWHGFGDGRAARLDLAHCRPAPLSGLERYAALWRAAAGAGLTPGGVTAPAAGS